MQTIVTLDWSRSVANEVAGATASTVKEWAELSVSKVYKKQVHHLYNYGMNACDDPVLVKNCIVQCFLRLDGPPELLTEDELFAIDIFKSFRRLLTQQIGMNFFPMETETMRGLSSFQREALFLKFQCGLTYCDVADIMQLPIEQLRGEIFKAVGILGREK